MIKDAKVNEKNKEVLLVKDVMERVTKSGKTYIQVTCSDKETEIHANIWDWNKKKFLEKISIGDLIVCYIIPKVYNNTLSYEIRGFGPAPKDINPSEYVKQIDPEKRKAMFDYLMEQTENMSLVFQAITKKVLEKYKDKLLLFAGGKQLHHNYIGGLLYHTYRMVELATKVSEVYLELDKDLLLSGCILHDIGKVSELSTDSLGCTEYTTEGNLFGHLLQGCFIVKEAADSLGYGEQEDTKLLLHLIASHHGETEYGAISIPSVPEAMVLHEIDMIDSRMDMFHQAYQLMEEGTTSDKIFGLNARVYKGKEINNK